MSSPSFLFPSFIFLVYFTFIISANLVRVVYELKFAGINYPQSST